MGILNFRSPATQKAISMIKMKFRTTDYVGEENPQHTGRGTHTW